MDELVVIEAQHLLLLGRQAERVTLLVERIDAREELFVEVDRIVVRGELGAHLGCHRIERVVGVGALEVEEGQRHALEHPARFLHRGDRVVERRRRRVVGDVLDLGEVDRHALLERRGVIGVADLVERRGLERQRAGLREDARALGHRGHPVGRCAGRCAGRCGCCRAALDAAVNAGVARRRAARYCQRGRCRSQPKCRLHHVRLPIVHEPPRTPGRAPCRRHKRFRCGRQ